MMKSFEDRERAYEGKFAHDQEMAFKDVVVRNRLLGMWAASVMSKNDDESIVYAEEVVRVGLTHGRDEDVLEKLSSDLGRMSDEGIIRTKMNEFTAEAASTRREAVA